jgi:fructokinase
MRIGIDLGGTKTEFIALTADGATRLRERLATPAGDYAATIRAIADGVRGMEARLGTPGTVGIGIPGSVSPATGLIRNANSTWLNGKPLERDLEQALGRPVRLANDANCFVLSEATDGAGAGFGVVFGAILGTGVGGGLTVDGRLLAGRNAIAGEWGHNPLPWPEDDEHPGPGCYCGRRGCIETFLSGPALARGCAVGGDASAEAGEPAARRAIARYEQRLARALAAVVNLVDPDVIVLGGGVSNIGTLYERVPALMPPWVFADRAETPIRPALHGDSSGVRGAAWLWPDGGAR